MTSRLSSKETSMNVHQEHIWAELDQQFRQGILNQLQNFVADELRLNQEQPVRYFMTDIGYERKNIKAFIRLTDDTFPFAFSFDISAIGDRARRWYNRWLSPPNPVDFDDLQTSQLNYISSIKKLNKMYKIHPGGEDDSYSNLAVTAKQFLLSLAWNSKDNRKDSIPLAANFEALKENRLKIITEFNSQFAAASVHATPRDRFCLQMRSYFNASEKLYIDLEREHEKAVDASQQVLDEYKKRLVNVASELGMAQQVDGTLNVQELRNKLKERFPRQVSNSTDITPEETSARQSFRRGDLTPTVSADAEVSARETTLLEIRNKIKALYGEKISIKYSRWQRFVHYWQGDKQDIYAGDKYGFEARYIVEQIDSGKCTDFLISRLSQFVARWTAHLNSGEAIKDKHKKTGLVAEIGPLVTTLNESALTVFSGQLSKMSEGCIDGDAEKIQVYEQYKQVASIVYGELSGPLDVSADVTETNPVDLIRQAKTKFQSATPSSPKDNQRKQGSPKSAKTIATVEGNKTKLADYINEKSKKISGNMLRPDAGLLRTFQGNQNTYPERDIRVIYILSLLEWFHALKSSDNSKQSRGTGSATTNDTSCFATIASSIRDIKSALDGNAFGATTINFSSWTTYDYYMDESRGAFKRLLEEVEANLPRMCLELGSQKQQVDSFTTGSNKRMNVASSWQESPKDIAGGKGVPNYKYQSVRI